MLIPMFICPHQRPMHRVCRIVAVCCPPVLRCFSLSRPTRSAVPSSFSGMQMQLRACRCSCRNALALAWDGWTNHMLRVYMYMCAYRERTIDQEKTRGERERGREQQRETDREREQGESTVVVEGRRQTRDPATARRRYSSPVRVATCHVHVCCPVALLDRCLSSHQQAQQPLTVCPLISA